ncbi:hypothetical protein C8Q72DRAFT_917492 [Fomitopsis betulina]|nr:hypothetical protein C8Q72DRAFT_917492 [Fomitopsis betulina]
MRVVDVPKTTEDIFDANEADPWMRYKFAGTLPSRWSVLSVSFRFTIWFNWLNAIRWHEHWTINRGDSILVYSAAENAVPPLQRAVNKFTKALIQRFLGLFVYFITDEQRKRRKETAEKVEAAIVEYLGERVRDLISLDNLATAKRAQRRGYASALVTHLTDLGDRQGRGVWLLTHEDVVGFYAQFGFKKIGHLTVGDDNPAWTEKPVVMCLLLRESPSNRMDPKAVF